MAACNNSSTSPQPNIGTPDGSNLTAGAMGSAYEHQLQASGTGPFVWTVVAGNLPPGLSLSASTGMISGTPTTGGSYEFTVQAENDLGTDQVEVTITIATVGDAPEITTTSLAAGAETVSYTQQLTATGTTPITWSVSQGALPAGLSLSPSTGLIAGTPTTAGTSDFTVVATNAIGADSQALQIVIAVEPSAPTIQLLGTRNGGTMTLPRGTALGTYSQTFQANGTSPITWDVTQGSLPNGTTLDEATGLLTGIPTTPGTSTFTVRATNSIGTDTEDCELVIGDQLTLTQVSPTTVPAGAVITLTGTGFDATTPSNNVVMIDSTPITLLTATETELTAQVPALTPGGVKVSVRIGNAVSAELDLTIRPTIIVYVNASVNGGVGDGSSWTDANPSLATALDDALNASPTPDEIWVAAGTYLPGSTTSDSFPIADGIQVFGGFDGTEGLRSERDPVQNTTILSGDLNGDDGANFTNRSDNSDHVVHFTGAGTLDGFEIEAGDSSSGFGSLIWSQATGENIVIANCELRDSRADRGAVGIRAGGAEITDCQFHDFDNVDTGALFVEHNTLPVTVTRCTFARCAAGADGGGCWAPTGGLTMRDCVFVDCTARYGGALSLRNETTIDNCTFYRCGAQNTGAIYIGGSSQEMVTLSRCLFSKNTINGSSTNAGHAINLNSRTESDVTITYCLIEGGSTGIRLDNNAMFAGSNNILDQTPVFVDDQDLDGTDDILGTSDDGLILQTGSPGVDEGGTGTSTEDVRRLARPVGAAHDIGAYETGPT